VIFATHDHSLLSSSPHRLVVIDDGRLIEASQGLRAWSARTQLSA
jgi:ABC-type ATPase involved in cell division